MNEDPSHDPLWKLLGHASKTEVSPYFARRVLREVRAAANEPVGLWDRLRAFLAPRRLGASFAAALVVAGLVSIPLLRNSESDASRLLSAEERSESFDPASEMAAVEYLGQLMAVADPGQLDDSALADLFF
ncbi:MAG TPA: hypothetical protein PLA50_03325 [Bacteroidia bacterium]|nr:hypothetical protein [Bacteroidia bacterium]